MSWPFGTHTARFIAPRGPISLRFLRNWLLTRNKGSGHRAHGKISLSCARMGAFQSRWPELSPYFGILLFWKDSGQKWLVALTTAKKLRVYSRTRLRCSKISLATRWLWKVKGRDQNWPRWDD